MTQGEAGSDPPPNGPSTGKRIENLYVALLTQVLLPLVPFIAEWRKDAGFTPDFWKAWETASAIYILGLAVACELRWTKVTGMGAGLFSVALYGFVAPTGGDPPLDVHDAFRAMALVVLGIVIFFIDRYYFLVTVGKAG
jgi:hypothetical protein